MSAPATSPVADLSYRHYDGPIEPPYKRWMTIARMMVQLAVKKKGFWGWSIGSSYFYFAYLAGYYFIDTFTPANQGGPNPILSKVIWKDNFLVAFSMSQILLLILALLIGAGTISNDNRTKALITYLSKPCTKFDYLFGKWLGIFIPLTVVSFIPAFFFYAYGIMSYRSYGFYSQDHWLFLKLIPMAMVPAALHSSISLGISSMFDQGRLAGAVYAGLYFISNFITVLAGAMYMSEVRSAAEQAPIASPLIPMFYASIDGLAIGMAKLILGTNGSPIFPTNFDRVVPAASAWVIVPGYLAVCAAGIAIAWVRVRAVEVVG